MTPPAREVDISSGPTSESPALQPTAVMSFTSPPPIPPARWNSKKIRPQTSPPAAADPSCRHPPRLKCSSRPNRIAGSVNAFGILRLITSYAAPTRAQKSEQAAYTTSIFSLPTDYFQVGNLRCDLIGASSILVPILIGPDLGGARWNQTFAVSLLPMLLRAVPIVVASALIVAVAPNPINAATSAYSIRSWPDSSRKRFEKSRLRSFIPSLPSNKQLAAGRAIQRRLACFPRWRRQC